METPMKKSSTIFVITQAAALTLFIWLLGLTTVFQNFEHQSLNALFKLRDQFHPTSEENADPRIVLVGIDDSSTTRLDTAWPFPRSIHAKLLAHLADEKPAVVAWDILFTDPKLDASHDDELLVEGAQLFPRFISCAYTDLQSHNTPKPLDKLGPTRPFTQVNGDLSELPPTSSVQFPFDTYKNKDGTEIPGLLQNSLFAFADSEPDTDGVRRYLPLLVNYQGKLFPTLSLQTVIQYLQIAPDTVTIEIGKQITLPIPGKPSLHIPINNRGQLLVNYRRTQTDFKSITYYDLLHLLSGKANLEEALALEPNFKESLKLLPPLTGNIVVVGFTGVGFDTGNTALQQGAPLVTVQLNAIENILHQDFLRTLPPILALPAIFLILLAIGFGILHAHLKYTLPIGLGGIVLYGILSYLAFDYGHLWIPTVRPLIAIVLTILTITAHLYFGENRQKRQIKAAMAAYLPAKILDRVLTHPDALKLGGTKRELTVLFCDIRGFTKYCDNKDPQEVVSVLNEYMEVMSEVIFQHEGTIDKYIGDCIMAFWNAPEDQPGHAQRAVNCAIAMRYALSNYKTRRAGIDHEIFECGIGIHTGPALVGNVGSSHRLSYSGIGATVTMAPRLESLTKQYSTRILISEAAAAQLQDDYTLTDLGQANIPGFAHTTRLYAVEAGQNIPAALLVAQKVSHQSNITVARVQNPLWKPAPPPNDNDESIEQNKD